MPELQSGGKVVARRQAEEFKSGPQGLTLYGTANYSAIIVSNAVTHLSSACSAFGPAINSGGSINHGGP